MNIPQLPPRLVSAFLRGAIDGGLTDSRVADELAWLNAELRSRRQTPPAHTSDFDYPASIQQARLYEIASFIKPAAHGLLTLSDTYAKTNQAAVHMLAIVRSHAIAYSLPNGMARGKLAVYLNDPLDDESVIEHGDIFGPHGRLGVRAITLAYASARPLITELGLVMPARNTPAKYNQRAWRSGFTVVRLGVTGSVYAETLIPNQIHERAPQTQFLRASLGLTDQPPADHHNPHAHVQDIDQVLGIKGGFGYLTAVLPNLGAYLGSRARQLELQHVQHQRAIAAEAARRQRERQAQAANP